MTITIPAAARHRPRPRPSAAAVTRAVLAFLADGSVWPTGELAEATGHRYNTDVYRALAQLHARGHAGRHKQPDLYSVWWQWWPSEGTCDTAPLDFQPERCRCWQWGGCWSCGTWARLNLTGRRA